MRRTTLTLAATAGLLTSSAFAAELKTLGYNIDRKLTAVPGSFAQDMAQGVVTTLDAQGCSWASSPNIHVFDDGILYADANKSKYVAYEKPYVLARGCFIPGQESITGYTGIMPLSPASRVDMSGSYNAPRLSELFVSFTDEVLPAPANFKEVLAQGIQLTSKQHKCPLAKRPFVFAYSDGVISTNAEATEFVAYTNETANARFAANGSCALPSITKKANTSQRVSLVDSTPARDFTSKATFPSEFKGLDPANSQLLKQWNSGTCMGSWSWDEVYNYSYFSTLEVKYEIIDQCPDGFVEKYVPVAEGEAPLVVRDDVTWPKTWTVSVTTSGVEIDRFGNISEASVYKAKIDAVNSARAYCDNAIAGVTEAKITIAKNPSTLDRKVYEQLKDKAVPFNPEAQIIKSSTGANAELDIDENGWTCKDNGNKLAGTAYRQCKAQFVCKMAYHPYSPKYPERSVKEYECVGDPQKAGEGVNYVQELFDAVGQERGYANGTTNVTSILSANAAGSNKVLDSLKTLPYSDRIKSPLYNKYVFGFSDFQVPDLRIKTASTPIRKCGKFDINSSDCLYNYITNFVRSKITCSTSDHISPGVLDNEFFARETHGKNFTDLSDAEKNTLVPSYFSKRFYGESYEEVSKNPTKKAKVDETVATFQTANNPVRFQLTKELVLDRYMALASEIRNYEKTVNILDFVDKGYCRDLDNCSLTADPYFKKLLQTFWALAFEYKDASNVLGNAAFLIESYRSKYPDAIFPGQEPQQLPPNTEDPF